MLPRHSMRRKIVIQTCHSKERSTHAVYQLAVPHALGIVILDTPRAEVVRAVAARAPPSPPGARRSMLRVASSQEEQHGGDEQGRPCSPTEAKSVLAQCGCSAIGFERVSGFDKGSAEMKKKMGSVTDRIITGGNGFGNVRRTSSGTPQWCKRKERSRRRAPTRQNQGDRSRRGNRRRRLRRQRIAR